jgi:hypothetical protein
VTNYYDLLKIDNNAGHEEIEAKLDDQYTKWRGLITHHDPEVVEQAQQALVMLEEMRTILLSPDKRSAYNAAIALQKEGIGGLADPDVVLTANSTGGAPPRVRQPKTSRQSSEFERTDAWICPDKKCQKANPVGTQFCAKCGNRIGFECPNCGELSEMVNQFCSKCGVVKEDHFKQTQAKLIKLVENRIRETSRDLHFAVTQPVKYAFQHKQFFERMDKQKSSYLLYGFIGAGATIGFLMGDFQSAIVGSVLGFAIGIPVLFLYHRNHYAKQVEQHVKSHLRPINKSYRERLGMIKTARYGANDQGYFAMKFQQQIEEGYEQIQSIQSNLSHDYTAK